MTNFSRKAIFAIEAVLEIANSAINGRPAQSGDISGQLGLPKRYLEPVLQELVRFGILRGARGPHGGYRLGRDASQISLADIVIVVRRTESHVDALDLAEGGAMRERIVRPVLAELASTWVRGLEHITIQELCERADGAGGVQSMQLRDAPSQSATPL